MTRQTRREFLRTSAGGILALGAGGSLVSGLRAFGQSAEAPPLERRNVVAGMVYHRLGRTNVAVSALACGVAPEAVMFAGLEKGINLIHTSTGYGTVPHVANLAKRFRDNFYIAIKRGPVEEYLKALGVDYVDFLFLPRLGPEQARDRQGRYRENFERLKRQGKVRFLGLTIHHKDLVGVTRAAVESDTWDVIMPQYQPKLRSQLDPLLARAKERNIGVLAMKTMVNVDRRAAEQQQAIIRTALATGHIDAVIRSIRNIQELERYVEAAVTPTSRRDGGLFQVAVASMSGTFCTACGRCAECPEGVEIAEILRCKDYYAGQMGDLEFARRTYAELAECQRVTNCAGCGRCERVCPEGLLVRRMLGQAHALLA